MRHKRSCEKAQDPWIRIKQKERSTGHCCTSVQLEMGSHSWIWLDRVLALGRCRRARGLENLDLREQYSWNLQRPEDCFTVGTRVQILNDNSIFGDDADDLMSEIRDRLEFGRTLV